MSQELYKALDVLASTYLTANYDMVWLKAMLSKGKHIDTKGTLITGSSHALYGINETFFYNCVNCSMHSQDLYYDFLCAKEVVEKENNRIEKCFIVLGYYIAFQDLSRSTFMREKMITPIYYPIFHDAHNWENPQNKNLWQKIGEVPEEAKAICEKLAEATILSRSTYYSDLKARKPFFDFQNRPWDTLAEEEKEKWGKTRAESHNKLIAHEASFLENTEILRDYVHFLHLHNILPVVVIPPFTKYYNLYADVGLKQAIMEMLEKIPEELHFVDFNDSEWFDDMDFMDTDHLNAIGADKMCYILTQIFGR